MTISLETGAGLAGLSVQQSIQDFFMVKCAELQILSETNETNLGRPFELNKKLIFEEFEKTKNIAELPLLNIFHLT